MSKKALEIRDEKLIHGASVPKVRMFIMIMQINTSLRWRGQRSHDLAAEGIRTIPPQCI